MSRIIPYLYCVGQNGLCAGLCTLCAFFTLGRWRGFCLVKWSHPPSGRMKLSVVGFSIRRQHSRKAGLVDIRICNRVTYLLIFPLCHRCDKANRVAISVVLFASWCLLEYMYFEVVESLGIIPGFLSAYCNLGFRLHVPPLYSTVSLMKAPALYSKKKKIKTIFLFLNKWIII